ncbi:hypothetical protein JHK84_029434 [Glycine max]|nr:hypothetical protein JHK84_029434 [Glycine max]
MVEDGRTFCMEANKAIVFNTDISEASRVQFFIDADSGNHVAPPTLSPAPNSNEDDHEITDMHIQDRDELEEMMQRNSDAPPPPPPPPPDKNEYQELPQSIVDMPPPKEELLSLIPDAPPVAPQTPMTVTENALPPRNPEFTQSPPPPPPPQLPLTVTPLKSHQDKE